MLTMTDYTNLLVLRYRNGAMPEAAALRFTQGEISAIQEGRHRAGGEPTAPDPLRLILQVLTPDEREWFSERAAILEYDGGLSREEAEAQAATAIISRNCPAPVEPIEKPQSVYQGSAAIKHAVAAGVGIKEFFTKSKDNDPNAYTADLKKIAELWNEGQRRFKAFIRGRFLAIDIDRKPGKPDGLEAFYRMFPRETLPAGLQNLPESFPCYTLTPSGGFHLYFRYEGPEVKPRELATGIEIKEWQITCPGSRVRLRRASRPAGVVCWPRLPL
jgi:hypothetical protein